VLTDFLYRVLAMIRKEFRTTLKDPSSRIILLVPALVQSLLFGYGATYDLKNIPYAVLDQSRSPSSVALLARFDSTGIFHRVANLDRPGDIAEVVNPETALMVVQIGPKLEADMLAGRDSAIQLILDARNSTTAGSTIGYVRAIVDAFNAEQRISRGAAEPPLHVEERAWFNPNLDTRWNIMPAMIAQLSLLQTLLLSALSVAREREQGTFDQTLVTPLRPMEIMIGKALPPMLIGLAQSTIVLAVTRFWFHVPFQGSLPLLYGGLVLFVLAAVGIGLSISAVSSSMQQAMQYTFFVVMPMSLLSGLATPVTGMSKALQTATLLNPLRFGIDWIRRIYLEGAGLSNVGTDLIPLLLIAAVTLPTAAWLFRNRLA
jgi:ABC-2 type transport system permease protein